MGFNFEELELKGAYVIDTFNVRDARGGFTKSFERDVFNENGIKFSLNETFYSISEKNVIRGLHFQLRNPQAKLVSVLRGCVWDVIVDLRNDSASFCKWISVELSDKNSKSLFIPKGFAHGFVSMENGTIMLYQCDGKYDKESDTGIRYDDPYIGIDWPVSFGDAIHSERDLALPSFNEYLENPMIV